MTDPTWTVHGADYDVEVDGLLGEFINRRRGQTVTLRFEIRRREPEDYDATATAGAQYSGSEGAQYSGSEGAQYSPSGTRSKSAAADAEARYRRLANYHDFAGAADVGVDDKQVPYYRESLPARADVSSLLIGVEPNGDIAPATGVWAVVEDGGEVSRLFGDMAVVELEVVVLGEYSELTRSEVTSQFEEPL